MTAPPPPLPPVPPLPPPLAPPLAPLLAPQLAGPPPVPHRRSAPAYTLPVAGNVSQVTDALIDSVGRIVRGKNDEIRLGAVLPADRGAPAARRRSGHRQDEPGQGDRRVDRRHLEACPVHTRPPAHRHHRRHGVRPERWLVLVPRGTGLHERADRRRDQPREPEDPVGVARGDGGTTGHRRRREPPGPPPVPRDRHPEPARLSRAPSRCPTSSSTASRCG